MVKDWIGDDVVRLSRSMMTANGFVKCIQSDEVLANILIGCVIVGLPSKATIPASCAASPAAIVGSR